MDENPIWEHFHAPYHRGIVSEATHTGYVRSAACGDEVTMYLEVHDNRIVTAGFVASGCMVCQAAASILCERVEGRELAELASVTADEVLRWIAIPLTPRRQHCGLLPFHAMKQALALTDSGFVGGHRGTQQFDRNNGTEVQLCPLRQVASALSKHVGFRR